MKTRFVFVLACLVALMFPALVRAHCDSVDGPVVADARIALEKKDLTPLLKWIKPQDEAQVRDAFNRTLAVRKTSPEAKELADNYFFETVVRIHRAGEGAAYTGLKPAGTMMPAIVEADEALARGSVDEFAKALSAHAAQVLRERYARAAAAKAHAADSVEAGREYVEAYSEYVHYVEGLATIIHGDHHEH